MNRNANFEQCKTQVPERRLWLAVLVQAVEDWRSANRRRRCEAEVFLFANQKDFAFVCSSAGIETGSLLPKLARLKLLLKDRFASGERAN